MDSVLLCPWTCIPVSCTFTHMWPGAWKERGTQRLAKDYACVCDVCVGVCVFCLCAWSWVCVSACRKRMLNSRYFSMIHMGIDRVIYLMSWVHADLFAASISVRVYLYVCVADMGMDLHTCIMSAHVWLQVWKRKNRAREMYDEQSHFLCVYLLESVLFVGA